MKWQGRQGSGNIEDLRGWLSGDFEQGDTFNAGI
jgi:hypothetical protein